MPEFRSKVTLRPRSKLERLLDLLADEPTPAPTAEYQALRARKHSEVAPTAAGIRVASRVGYPGNEAAAVSRALDAEVPEGDLTSVAWRAHHHLHVIGERWCHAAATTKDRAGSGESKPDCKGCPIHAVCDYGGLGLDPALRLTTDGS